MPSGWRTHWIQFTHLKIRKRCRRDLFGRDPSILAYNQRPLPSESTKRNLLLLYEAEEDGATKFSENSENSSENSESHIRAVKVYLRLKPFPRKLKLTEEQQNAYEIVNSTTLITKLPILDNTTAPVKQSSKNTENICKKFTFSKAFGPEVTQLELFEQVVQFFKRSVRPVPQELKITVTPHRRTTRFGQVATD